MPILPFQLSLKKTLTFLHSRNQNSLTQINWTLFSTPLRGISPCRLDFLSGNELVHIFAHELMQLSPKGTKQ